MEVKLIIVKGRTNRAEVTLKLPGTIGRSREADVTIAHSMISRQHCQLFEADGRVKIRDLGSLNGTYLGADQITEAELLPHAEFSIGPVAFRVEYEYDGLASETPESLPEPEQGPEGEEIGEPEFLPAVEEPPAAEPAVASPPPPPRSPGVPLTGFDAAAPDLSGWSAAVHREQADLPLEGFLPASPAPAAQAAEPPASEDESFVGDIPVPGLSADVPPLPATEEPISFAELPVGETPGEPPDAEVSAEPAEELIEALPSEPEPTVQPEGDQPPASEAAEETPATPAAAEAPGKKLRWWPFGRGKKKAKAEGVAPAALAAPVAPPSFEPAPDFLAVSDTPQAPPAASQPEEEPATDDEALNAFFKGLK